MTRKNRSSNNKGQTIGFSLLFLGLLIVLAVLTVSVYGAYFYYSHDLPDLTKITGYRPPVITEVYSSDGKLIGQFASERRKLISYDEIPPHVKHAFIAIEDKRFFDHEGIDLLSIFAAMMENIREGDWVRGASTITQQVTKNLVLSPEKSISRKIREAILAYRMENNLSKEEILYIYLNEIYLADGYYGIEAASENFFGKSARDINLAEAAILAALPKRPEYYNPRKHYDRAIARQRLILKKMENQGLITREQRQKAEDYKIVLVPGESNINTKIAPYFVELVRQYLQERVGVSAFVNGGYKVFTTLDTELALAAGWVLRRGIIDIENRHGRGIVIKHLSGEGAIEKFRSDQNIFRIEEGKSYEGVVTEVSSKPDEADSQIYSASVGLGSETATLVFAVSTPFGNPIGGFSPLYSEKYAPLEGYDGVSLVPVKFRVGDVIKVKAVEKLDDIFYVSLNYVPSTQGAIVSMNTEGFVSALVGGYNFSDSQFNRATQALRQPGSAFKPIVYSAAIDKGYTETTIVYDLPVTVKDWSPSNYDGTYSGAIVLRRALAQSRNLATVRVMLDINPGYVADYADKFGFTTKLKAYPSLALGGSEVRLIDMVKAYNVFAADGRLIEPQMVLRIYDRKGKIIEDNINKRFISSEESERVEREEKRKQILKNLAEGKGNSDSNEGLKQQQMLNSTEFSQDTESVSLNPEEFLKLVRSDSIDLAPSQTGERTLSSETAYIMTDLLQAVIREGTGRRALHLTSLAPLAGKTGTTNDFTDAWFVGYSPNVTTGVWVGKDNHRTIGAKEAGSRAALPIWIDFMETALKVDNKDGSFKVPAGIKIVSTAYGPIPYRVDSLRAGVIDSIRSNRTEEDLINDSNGNGKYKKYYEMDKGKEETKIDFLLDR